MADGRVLSGENISEDINSLNNDTFIDYDELILEALKRRKINKQSCDTLSLVEDLTKPEDVIRRTLENLVQANLVVQKQYKGKLTYTPIVTIDNACEKASFNKDNVDNTDLTALASDFIDFKFFITNQVQQLEEKLSSQPSTSYDHHHQNISVHENIVEHKSGMVDYLKEEIKFLREENLDLRSCIIKNQQCMTSDINSHSSNFIIKLLEKQLDEKQKIIETLLQQKISTLNNNTISLSSHEPIDTSYVKEFKVNNVTNKHTKPKITSSNNITTNVLPQESKNTSDVNDINGSYTDNLALHYSDDFPVEEKQKRNVCIIGDSIVNGINPNGFKKDSSTKRIGINPNGFNKVFNVKVRPHGGATSEDMIDYIKPTIRKKPDDIIIHVGTNDITKNNVNTVENLQKIVNMINKDSPGTKICISSVTKRTDKKGLEAKIKSLNIKLKDLCTQKEINWLDHSNIDNSHLSNKKLHLNQKGLAMLAKNFISYLD